ncbi:hypothetical protein K3495_g515 [Podosphaera aphanis]|nr:hypothetical protein K3495_g515 [Podosphaera aphanis]
MQRLTYLLILLSAIFCCAVDPAQQPDFKIEDQYTCPNGKVYPPSDCREAVRKACRLLMDNRRTYGTTRFPRAYTKDGARNKFIFPIKKGEPYRGRKCASVALMPPVPADYEDQLVAKSIAGNVFVVVTYNPVDEGCTMNEVVQKISVVSRVMKKLRPGSKKGPPQSGQVSKRATGLFRTRYDKCVRADYVKILHGRV